MPGDTRHIQRVEITFRYLGELSEDQVPEPGTLTPVIAADVYSRVRRWHVNRVFYFLTISSALCLATVALVPKPVVQATSLGIWATSAGLARFLLAGTYRKPRASKELER